MHLEVEYPHILQKQKCFIVRGLICVVPERAMLTGNSRLRRLPQVGPRGLANWAT